MAQLKSEKHHWWPRALSSYWASDDGCVNWLGPTGEVKRIPHPKLGSIGNGHFVKLGGARRTPFDESYEAAFQAADDSIHRVIPWLGTLRQESRNDGRPLAARFIHQPASDEQISDLIALLVSLAVRSPMTREQSVALAEHFRGRLPETERNAIIGLSLRRAQLEAIQALGTRRKFVVIHSPGREFIYGDGFCHNVTRTSPLPLVPKMLVPLTPGLAVLYVRPSAYNPQPRLLTLQVDAAEADALNRGVQVYAAKSIFYRADAPQIEPWFARGQHLQFADTDNPVDELIDHIPGTGHRDRELEALLRGLARPTHP